MSQESKFHLPDIGDFDEVEVIEIHVDPGTIIALEDPIITVESEKASMDIPSSLTGEVTEIAVQLGSKISQGDHILTVRVLSESPTAKKHIPSDQKPELQKEPKTEQFEADATERSSASVWLESQAQSNYGRQASPPPTLPPPVERAKGALPHASPSIRRFARQLGADLSKIRGRGAKGRILREDVKNFVKQTLQSGSQFSDVHQIGPPPLPEVDFSKFGQIDTVTVSKIKRITGDRLHRSWLDIPHVTHHDEADITELDHFRKIVDSEQREKGTRVTILAFICKAIISALQTFPTFNASLSPDRQSIILKKYINIGVAVDTSNGLVVPVIKGIDTLGVLKIAKALQELGERARAGTLTPADFQGGCFTISSLGGIGGRFFTPIINPPEVAILGVSRHHPVAIPSENGVDWKTMLPLSLSYDHRVIDGAEAARFVKLVGELLYDARRMLL